MKLSADTQRRLVLLNTAILALFLAVGLAALALLVRNDKVRSTIRSVVAKEKQQSEFLASLGGDREEAPLERWSLKIKPRHMRQIQALSERLREAQALTDEDKRWFPAELTVDGETYDGRVRLRGDLGSHWRGAKKSWRFRAKSERYVRGYRTLDLIIPRDKGYEVEWVSYEMARELGLFAPDAGFVEADLNGVDMGAYFWREPPGKEALERLRYPEGEIFAEQNTWIQERFSGRGIYRLYSPPVSFFPANWEGDVHGGTAPAGYFAARWNQLLALIDDPDDARFVRELPYLLDVEKYLTWNALTWLFGSTHSHWGDNLSWYHDNTTGRFEPLLYDVFRYPIENQNLGTFEATEHDELALRVLGHASFRQRRNEILWRLVTEEQFDVARRTAAAGAPVVGAFARGVDAPTRDEVEDFRRQTVTILDANRRLIHDHLSFGRVFAAPELDIEAGAPVLRLRLVPDALADLQLASLEVRMAPGATLDVADPGAVLVAPDGARTPVGVAIEAVADDESSAMRIEFAEPVTLTTPVDAGLVPRMATYLLEIELPRAEAGVWQTPGTVADIDGRFVHSLSGETLPASHVYRASPAYAFNTLPAANLVDTDSSTGAGGLRWRRDGDVLVVEAGTYRLTEDIVIRPAGRTLRLEAGVRLLMGPGVSVVHRGPLEVRGTADRPVEILPLEPSEDGGAPWGSFGVVAAAGRSRVTHLRVSGGNEEWIDGIYLSGQLCFYSSDVDLDRVAVLDGRADDGLNIKRASFTIRDSTFDGNAFDAFDGDWVVGTIENSRFVDNGGDGLDVSGADVTVRGSLFARQGDKSISVGERSTVTVYDSVLRDSVTGLASKDLSNARVISSVLYGNQTALALYRKKPIFGGGKATLVASTLWRNDADYQLDAESSITLVGVGQDTFAPTPGIATFDHRVSPVGAQFAVSGEAEVTHTGGSASPFHRGPVLDDLPPDVAAALDDVELVDVESRPLGLGRPLDLSRCPRRDSN